jgi:NADPH-dependent stearoyl-CoA 9-desaturase
MSQFSMAQLHASPILPSQETVSEPDPEQLRLQQFGVAIEAIRKRTQAKVGAHDLRYIRRVDRISRVAELFGRTLIAVSPGPILFTAGVLSLFVYKQLQATEIGHMALHGAYNRIPDAGKFHSNKHQWQFPIDEQSWLRGHNGRHHGLTNVAGHDADIHFGPVRLTEHTPHRFGHYFQLPFTLLILFPNFGPLMNLHFTGLTDVWNGNGRASKYDFLEDGSRASVRDAYRRALRKYVPYYAKEYLLWPTLALLAFGWWLGPLVFLKSVFGNWLAEKLRDIYSAASIFCGHVGEHTVAYPEGTLPAGKGERYAMQVESTNNYEVPWLVSVFCGALDRQIEHHLFPSLPPNRLREITSEVRATCEAHGVNYLTASWPRMLLRAFAQVGRLSRKLPHERITPASSTVLAEVQPGV